MIKKIKNKNKNNLILDKKEKTVAVAHRIVVDHKVKKQILDYFEDRKVTVEIKNYDNYHMVITGDERIVNFYPTTGTINCNPCAKYKAFKLRGARHETALKRVVDLANIGY